MILKYLFPLVVTYFSLSFYGSDDKNIQLKTIKNKNVIQTNHFELRFYLFYKFNA
jgi:hypothetical protein